MTLLRAAVFLAAVALAGCSGYGTKPADDVEIKGKVTMADGKPLATGTLYLSPILGTGAAREEYVKIDKGEFTAKVIPGKYKVAVDPASHRKGRTSVPEKFTNPENSGIEVDLTQPKSDLEIPLK